jgi:chloramphenicol 3-O phosphotransferase
MQTCRPGRFIGPPAEALARGLTGLREQRSGYRYSFRIVRAALYRGAVTTQLIILNGGSSSGKSGIIRCLQAVLPDPWLAFGCDSLVEAMPARMQASREGIVVAADGGVSVGADFRALEAAWMDGIATMARAGARVIIDEVFLGGAACQQRWQQALAALWVGVRCASAVAAGREVARGDRTLGMAASQAAVVHEGVRYDLEVDTTHAESLACSRAIAAHVS